ncbi:MAG: hypothetical protein QOG00_650 [Pyrinomonadaceae bacterium]|nr:hypothetical protein [Pyrinomonadaceae bacterium]
MKLRQMFVAFILVLAIQMSTPAQKIFSEGDEAGDAQPGARHVETANASAPDADPTTTATERAKAAEARAASLPAPVPTPLRRVAFRNELHAESYLDAYRILGEENTCSRFFGGSAKATGVLNSLAEQFRNERFESPNVAIQMSGTTVLVHDNRTGASYRLFERVLVNSIGPLFVAPTLAKAQRRAIGRFSSDTRAARALILLHELGHLVQGADGRWLLPNDGHDAQLSVQNTTTVESHCLKQLTSLKY